jgi:hypothetical protein
MGDSPPEQWKSSLEEPLDRRHPARHNIWTPVVDVVQNEAFAKKGWRLDEARLYVRNAVSAESAKPDDAATDWGPETLYQGKTLANLLELHRPALVVTFGAFAFEFVRRCLGEAALPFRKWTTEKLGIEMRRRMRDYSPNGINVLPALHATIARRHFLVSHRRYCPDPGQNYFEHVGTELSKVLIEHADDFGIFRQFVPGK